MKYKATEKKLDIHTIITESSASMTQKTRFNKEMARIGYGLFEKIDFCHFIDIAKANPCFLSWLLDNEYIIKLEDDKWNPNKGNWIRVGWENIGNFKPGVMLNRILRSKNNVMEVIEKVFWREWCDNEELLAIKVRYKNSIYSSGYWEDEYYISDLFSGDKVMMKVK